MACRYVQQRQCTLRCRILRVHDTEVEQCYGTVAQRRLGQISEQAYVVDLCNTVRMLYHHSSSLESSHTVPPDRHVNISAKCKIRNLLHEGGKSRYPPARSYGTQRHPARPALRCVHSMTLLSCWTFAMLRWYAAPPRVNDAHALCIEYLSETFGQNTPYNPTQLAQCKKTFDNSDKGVS